MNLLYHIARVHVPAVLKKKGVALLFGATANAFDHPVPSIVGMSYTECLEEYARFSERVVRWALDGRRDVDGKMRAMRRNAYQLGLKFRTLFGVRTRDDAMAAARLLYGILGIDFCGSRNGDITIAHCAFASCYSAGTCRVMSAFDEGVLAGLAGDGTLTFTERLTEGQPSCRARFAFTEETGA